MHTKNISERVSCFVIIIIFVIRSESNTQNIKTTLYRHHNFARTREYVLCVALCLLAQNVKYKTLIMIVVFFEVVGYHVLSRPPHILSLAHNIVVRSMGKFWICPAHDLHPLSRHDHQYMTHVHNNTRSIHSTIHIPITLAIIYVLLEQCSIQSINKYPIIFGNFESGPGEPIWTIWLY